MRGSRFDCLRHSSMNAVKTHVLEAEVPVSAGLKAQEVSREAGRKRRRAHPKSNVSYHLLDCL